MIVSLFIPKAIIVATASFDTFFESRESEEGTVLAPIYMEGLQHTYTFWNRYSIVFNSFNNYIYEADLIGCFDSLRTKWDKIPSIEEFVPYFKKMVVDNHIQMIGILSAFDNTGTPYVYQILGESMRRINLDNEGRMNYNCVYLEKKPHIGKLLQQTRVKNGDSWEECSEVRLRCDLYSTKKAIDICRFMLRTSYYVDNINSAFYDTPLQADMTITTPTDVETKLINI